MRVSLLPVLRPTFDVAAAQEFLEGAVSALHEAGHTLVGSTAPALGDDEVVAAAEAIAASDEPADAIVVLQGTFTTAVGASIVARRGLPVVLWSFPEPDGGHRLRLNSLCGLTLASYALHHAGAPMAWVHGDPADPATRLRLGDALSGAAAGDDPVRVPHERLPAEAVSAGRRVAEELAEVRIGRIGEPPDGFDPCVYDPDQLREHTGVIVDELPLDTLIGRAGEVPVTMTRKITAEAAEHTTGLDQLDPEGVDHSVRLLAGMRELVDEHGWSALCTRCWPECMADYGGAVCWPSAEITDAGIPAGCEADVLGTVTGLALQQLTDSPAFLADLVAVDIDADTGTLWHCGVAPASLAHPDVQVRLAGHPNRGTPLVHVFPLRPGRVTLARLTRRPGGALALVIGSGEVLDIDPDLHGTSAVVRFDRPVAEVLDRVLGDGLDHHVSLVYGDVAEALEALAAEWGIGVIDLWRVGAAA